VNTDAFDRSLEAADVLRAGTEHRPTIGLVLGSGLGAWADGIATADHFAFAELPGFHAATVAGHAGRVVVGHRGGVPIAALQGRVHAYEGHPARDVVHPVRTLWQFGVRTLVVTNAAGGIAPSLRVGDLMLIRDHINLTGANPLVGPNDPRFGGPRFPDMTEAYDRELRGLALAAASEIDLVLDEGVYVGVSGPTYETPAEIEAFGRLGGSAVGMSTVPEVIAARHLGMRVLGISLITNAAAGLGEEKLDHADVQEVGRAGAARFGALLDRLLPRLLDA
jgi:purine-nucleoside phosphorylase